MGYTADELQNLKNPYKHLGKGDALAEHREELNNLPTETKRNLAARMILKCPPSELKMFHGTIEAGRTPHDDEETFHSVLAQAYEVKHRIFALLDPRNKNPHLLVLNNEFNEALFHPHKQLALDVLKDNEAAIAERLALTTPQKDRSQLAFNVQNIFSGSVLSEKINQAFTIRRDIEQLLLGDDPHQFFASREYSIDACHEFAGLFTLAAEKESSIAAKLALTTPEKLRSKVSQNLRSLAAPAKNELASAVGRAFELRRNIDTLLSDNPEQFFSRGFSSDLCNEFSVLFPVLLQGQEMAIAAKLSLLDKNTRTEICRKLETINGSAHDQANIFRVIGAAIASTSDEAQKPASSSEPPAEQSAASSSGSNPHSLFGLTGLAQRRSLLKPPAERSAGTKADETSAEKSAKEDGCCKSLCGMF